jgi:signal transduction histidine kinase
LVALGFAENGPDGEVKSVLSIVRDLTEIKRAERERAGLLAREQEARQTAEILNRVGPTLAAELDVERLTQSLTDIATELVGAEFGSFFHNVTDEAGGSYLLYTLSGVPREAFAGFPMPRNTRVFAPTFAGQGILRSDDITRDPRYGKNAPHYGMPKGHLPVCSYLAAPVVSRSGEVIGGLFFGHSRPGRFQQRHEDLIAGLAAQAAIAMDNARLFEHSQRTQNALRRSNQELVRVNKDLETFAYSASHDLQEPLRNIALSAQLLERRGGSLADEGRVFLAAILEGAFRMQALVRDLLAYTRAAQGEAGPFSIVSASSVLEGVLQALSPMMREAEARVTYGELPPVAMHETHLAQVFQNLISNAIKYRSGETPYVHVSAIDQGGSTVFYVADNGIGIDPRFKEQIFGLFKRLHTRDQIPGSGIGLAICQRIVEQYGGRIWLDRSALGEGSVFCFSVPTGPAS